MVPPQLAFGGSMVYKCLAVHQALLCPSYHIKSFSQARSFPAPKSFFFRVRNQTPKTAPVFPKTCRFQTLSGWLRTTPRLRNEGAVRYAAMESRNSTPGTIDFRSFTWTSTVQTAGIEESCPSGAELPVGARMIRIKWMN